MRLDDAYLLLDLTPDASDDELRAAHRDLTKVWHPDRFATDPSMQRKAEEKLKAINEAYEAIREARAGRWRRPQPPPPREGSSPRDALRRLLGWMFMCVFLAFFFLLRRPTLGGLLIAGTLFGIAGVLILRMRQIEKKMKG